MSDETLHAVLNLPLSAWQDTPIDRCQRHARYVQASQRIRALEGWIRDAGMCHNICTYEALREVCANCQCSRAAPK